MDAAAFGGSAVAHHPEQAAVGSAISCGPRPTSLVPEAAAELARDNRQLTSLIDRVACVNNQRSWAAEISQFCECATVAVGLCAEGAEVGWTTTAPRRRQVCATLHAPKRRREFAGAESKLTAEKLHRAACLEEPGLRRWITHRIGLLGQIQVRSVPQILVRASSGARSAGSAQARRLWQPRLSAASSSPNPKP
jgi:hypothetical protein